MAEKGFSYERNAGRMISGESIHFHTLEDVNACRPCDCEEPIDSEPSPLRITRVDHERRSITIEEKR